MQLPAHVAERIREAVARHSSDFPIDEEARRHGAIALMGTIGAIWMLRPDGTFWNADADFGIPLGPLPDEWHMTALVYGSQRFPWLAELLPRRPPGARSCPTCEGSGFFPAHAQMACTGCRGLGWLTD